MRERDRVPLLGTLPGEGFRLIADVFTETGARGRITTWRLDIRRPRDSTERQPWRIVGQEKLCDRSKGCIGCRCTRRSSSRRAIW